MSEHMSEHLFRLPIQQHISQTLSLRQQDQLQILVVDHPVVKAAISLQGAHLLAWQPSGADPVIWLSEKAIFTPQTPIRGGVPICWPWFGKTASPSHGFARILPWQLIAQQENAQGVTLTFRLQDSEHTREYWPHTFTLLAHFHLADSCTIELEAQGEYQSTGALHSYLQIGDISRISVTGLGQQYQQSLKPGEIFTAPAELRFEGEVDRIYTAPSHHSLISDPFLQRTIEITHRQQSDVVAWNPGQVIAHNLNDMADDGYKTMVCIETARISQPMQSQPDNPARLSVSFRCLPFSSFTSITSPR